MCDTFLTREGTCIVGYRPSEQRLVVLDSSRPCASPIVSFTFAHEEQDCAIHARGNLLCSAHAADNSLHLWDLRIGGRAVCSLLPEPIALLQGASHSNIARGCIRDVFVLSEDGLVFANAAQNSGFYLRWDIRASTVLFHKSGATRAVWANEFKSLTAHHYGQCEVLDLKEDAWMDASGQRYEFQGRPGPSCLHFDHSTAAVGGGTETLAGRGSGILAWKL